MCENNSAMDKSSIGQKKLTREKATARTKNRKEKKKIK